MTVRHNRVTNPKMGADLNAISASQQSGTPSLTRVVGAGGSGGPFPSVSTWARATVVGTPTYVDVRHASATANVVAEDEEVVFDVYARPSTSAPIVFDLYIQWIDNTGAVMPSPALATSNSAGSGWGRYLVTDTAPTGAVRANLIVRMRATSGTLANGDRLDVTGLMFELGSVALAYFDPDTNGWASWDGSPNGSTSVYYAPTLQLFPTLDGEPCPRVELLVTDIPPQAATVTAFRVTSGREYQVRGAVQTVVAGALSRVDYEVPFGVDASYRIQMFTDTGLSLGFSSTAIINLDVEETWVHNPLDPQGSAVVAFDDAAARSIQRPFEGDIVWPQGRTVGVVLGGQRRGIQDVVLDVRADIENADKLQAMFGSYGERTTPVICFRIGSRDRVRLPRPLFAGVLTLDERDMNYVIGGDLVTVGMTGSEVDPPTPGLFVPLLTRADLNAYYPTRDALNSDNESRLAVNRRYDLAGNGS